MSNSKARRFSISFIWTITTMLIFTGIVLGLIYTFGQRIEDSSKKTEAKSDIKDQNISYDKNKILVDDTAEPLEIVELPGIK